MTANNAFGVCTALGLKTALWIYFSAITLIAFYITDWLLGWPDALSPQLQKMNRLTIFGLLFMGAFISWYWFKSRKFCREATCRPAGLGSG